MPAHKRNTTAMQEARQKIAEEKYNTLKTVLEDMIHNKEEITIPRIVQLSKLSKSYLYKNERAKALIEDAKNQGVVGYLTKKTDLDVNLKMNKADMLLQYEDVKRKLHDSYVLEHQLLTEENGRLKHEINCQIEKLKKLRERPYIKVHFIPKGFDEDYFGSYQVKSKANSSTFNPLLSERMVKGFTTGQYIMTGRNMAFSLGEPISGVSIIKAEDDYILEISELVTENITINILITPEETL